MWGRLSVFVESVVRWVVVDMVSSLLMGLPSLLRLTEWFSWLMFFLDVLNSKYSRKCFNGHEIKLQLLMVCWMVLDSWR